MKEITRLNIRRKQLLESVFYYNGCECRDVIMQASQEQTTDKLLELAADMLIHILESEPTDLVEEDVQKYCTIRAPPFELLEF